MQPAGDRGHHAIGGGIAHIARGAIRKCAPVGRIDQCQGVGPAQGRAQEQIVERRVFDGIDECGHGLRGR